VSQSPTPEEINEAIRSRYISLMAPLFLPADTVSHDIVRYFASLLRVVGMEDKGWDPYLESRAVLDDLYALMRYDLADSDFSDRALTPWRLGLIFYNHIVEMDAPYEVIANLLRFRLGKGYSPNPFWDFMTNNQKKNFRNAGMYPKQKIDIIKRLGSLANLEIGTIFDDFYRSDLRNAISHSDFIFTEEGFRCRNGNWTGAFEITFEELDTLITKAKVFIGTFLAWKRRLVANGARMRKKGSHMTRYIKGSWKFLQIRRGL
jgi:hypothetical protein